MSQQKVLGLTLATVLALAACGGGPPPPAATDQPAPEGPAAATTSAARDVTAFDVCALVPIAEIATVLGGSPGARPPNGNTYPGTESECWYEVARGPGRTPETVGVLLYPPGYYASAQEEGATEIGDLGDGAFLSPRTDIATVIVLKKGVATIEARAGDADHARKLADLVLAKLDQP